MIDRNQDFTQFTTRRKISIRVLHRCVGQFEPQWTILIRGPPAVGRVDGIERGNTSFIIRNIRLQKPGLLRCPKRRFPLEISKNDPTRNHYIIVSKRIDAQAAVTLINHLKPMTFISGLGDGLRA